MQVSAPVALLLCLLTSFAALADAPPATRGDAGVPIIRSILLPDFAALVRSQAQVVVNIRVFRATAAEHGKPRSTAPHEAGLGSGFVVAPNGIILTNRHVILDADKITVRFADKHELVARLLGVDPLTDVAVLKVEAENLPTAMLGDSSRLEVGQWVLAIGAPLGLERTATQGIISALGRSLPDDSYVPFIQTDVPINPGNSGGPLFDVQGRVVGINSQIVSHTGGYMGLSFAIPINTAVTVARQIAAQGHATHGWLGVNAQELSQELAHAYGLEVPRGALITGVKTGGPADQAGLQAGDIVLALDSTDIIDSADMAPLIGASVPGSNHQLTVLRDGKVNRIKVQVGELGSADKSVAPRKEIIRLGLLVSDLNDATRQVLDIHGGVLVEGIAPGPAADADIQPGDILLKLGRMPIENSAQMVELTGRLEAGQTIPVLVRRQDNVNFVLLTLPDPGPGDNKAK
jgi:serine protease Do